MSHRTCKHVSSTLGQYINREYVYTVAVYQKYLTRLGELIIFEPWRENYHFSQPLFLTPTNINLAVYGNGLGVVMTS